MSLYRTGSYTFRPVHFNRHDNRNETRRDSIITSFRLHERDFHIAIEENENEILYKATEQSLSSRNLQRPVECLGYVRWFRQNGAGTVEVTNRQATLQPWNLDMGSSSKVNESNQAGVHGEGLKLALLVLLRRPQNYYVTCYSGGFEWIFNFTNHGKLFTSLTRLAPEEIAEMHNKTSKRETIPLPFTSVPNGDVQFFIGGIGRGRDEKGYPIDRSEVTKEQFKNWTKSAVFFQKIDVQHFLRTDQGDLITDKRFSGRIYLKGLLLNESIEHKSASLTGFKLKYGYNFVTRQTNRERQSIGTSDDESCVILSIWDRALALESSSTHLIERFHNMLNCSNYYADVIHAGDHIRDDTVCRLRDYLFSGTLKKKWYFCSTEASEVWF